MARPERVLTASEEATIRRLHGEGASRNAMAKAVGVAPATMTRFLAELGLSIDRAAPEEAIRARSVDMAVRRQQLAEALLVDAARLREQMWRPYQVYSFGGRENTFETAMLPEPPAQEKLALLRSASGAIDKSLRLVEFDRGGEADAAKSMLGRLAEAMAQAVAEDPEP